MRVEIAGSMGALLSPTYELVERPDGHYVTLRIDVPDANGGPPFKGLPSEHPITQYQRDRISRDPFFLANLLRTFVLRALEHELDESITIDGRGRSPRGTSARKINLSSRTLAKNGPRPAREVSADSGI
jgi:hypothetical protein